MTQQSSPQTSQTLSVETAPGSVIASPGAIFVDKEMEYQKKYHETWYQKNKERISILEKKYRAENKKMISERSKQYRPNHKEMFRIKDHNRFLRDKEKRLILTKKIHLKNMFGISVEQYNEIFIKQGEKCAICGGIDKVRLGVDHNHTTGKVRGLLCNNCNRGLGHFKDSEQNLLKAIEYLKQGDKS